MTPPETLVPRPQDGVAPGSPAASSCPVSSCPAEATEQALTGRLTVMAKRADFLRAANARRQGAGSFLLQARRRAEGEPATGIRVGYTCSKKVGNSVIRNRARRRLREAARAVLPRLGQPGWDYVLVGRPGATIERPFADLIADLEGALRRIHAERRKDGREDKR